MRPNWAATGSCAASAPTWLPAASLPIAERGGLAFAPAARVRHLNRTQFIDFLRHQFRLGSSFSEVCARVPFPDGAWGRLPLAPFSGVLRVPWLWHRLRECCPPTKTDYLPREVFFGRLDLVGVFFSVWPCEFGRFFPATSGSFPASLPGAP